MSTISLAHPSTWPSFPYVFACLLPVWLIGVFFASLSTPASHNLLDSVGFPQPRDKPLHYFWYMFAIRELLLGCIFALLEFHGEWKSVAIVLGVSCCGGAMDVVMSATKGGVSWMKGIQAHGIVTAVGTYSAYQLWLENR
jgi:hypothetical protein